MAKALSKTQQEVVDLMRDGWQLGTAGGFSATHPWLQKGGCGRGGKSKSISMSTFSALFRAGIIEKDTFKYPVQTYRLNEGKDTP